MFAIPGIVALVILIYARPQEFIEPLKTFPLLYAFFFLSLFGLALDWRLKNSRLFATPQLPWVLLFYLWCVTSALIHSPRLVHVHAMALGIAIVLYLIIGHGIQSFRGLAVAGGTVLLMVLFVAAVGVHQGFAETGCVLVDESVPGDQSTGTFDGRPCTINDECYLGNAEPGGQYLCEKIGLFGTTSVSGGRVRYRGVLQDPNELALTAGIGLPLAFAWTQRRRKLPRWLIVLLSFALVLVCTIFSQSRSGELVFLTILGAYFIRRYGARGILAGAVLAAPVLLLGGRAGGEAESSTMERIDCWYEALSMWRSSPLLGVGYAQFGEYHYLTAHNAYLLTLAELGLPGLILFGTVVYVSARIPLDVLRRYGLRAPKVGELSPSGSWGVARGSAPEQAAQAGVARTWAMTLLAAFGGLCVGMLFLSFAYHYVLWIYIGLSGALYGAVKRHDASFNVRLTWKDGLLILVATGFIIVGSYALTRSVAG